MRQFIKTISRKDLIGLAICFCLYLLLALQSCPLSSDDFTYRFNQMNDEAITSFCDVLQSNAYGYMHVNGRFLVHVCIQTILAWDLHTLFICLSGLACVILLFSMLYLVRRTQQSQDDLIYVLLGLILFWPLMATSFYGTVCMTINYMWSAAIYMFFLAVYFHVKEDNVDYSLWKLILLFIFGLICGSWQESFGIGIGGAICLYHLFNLRRTNKSTYALIIGFGIGLCILIFAPGNFVRVGVESDGATGISDFIYRTIQLCKHNLFVDVWLAIGLISIIVDAVRKEYFAFIKSNWLYFLSATIAFAFTLYTIAMNMMQGTWQLTILGVIDAILMVKFLQTYLPRMYQSKSVAVIILVCMSVFAGSLYGYRHVLKIEKQAFIHEFLAQKSDAAYDGRLQYTIQHVIPTRNEFVYKHVCDMYCSFYNEKTIHNLSKYTTKGAATWGTTLMPERAESIIANCVEANELSPNVYLAPLQYYIVRIPKEEIDNTTLVLYVKKNAIRTKRYIESYPISILKCVEDDNYTYGVKTLDWWHYHHCEITNVELKEE